MRNILWVVIILCMTLMSCKSENKQEQKEDATNQANEVEKTASEEPSSVEKEKTTKEPLHWDTIEVTSANIGDFPFFNAPKGFVYKRDKTYDYYSLDFYINGHFQTIEGKVYMSSIEMERDSDGKRQPWNEVLFRKSFEDYIASNGGQLLFKGKVPKEDVKAVSKKHGGTYLYEHIIGNESVYRSPISIYAINTGDKRILVQLWASTAEGQIGVLQLQDFEQTITKVTADEIKKELDDKGFIALYINFDTGKSRIKTESYSIIDEIKKLMTTHKDLDIAIEGHTDNVGQPKDNQKLSENRARAVLMALVDEGVDESRLSSQGFGDTKPIESNDTDDGKAKNRRVEIRKK
ncbi:OmpA family protein [Aquimarina sp. 2304DJ70-9]|uniref:OmpA family protein n=1 Tax=Aquimarina penaris TaxID=3231044 RepID=UPI0034630DAD